MPGINPIQLRDTVIVPTLDYLGLSSPVAVNLVLGTAIQESGCGTYLRQLGQGPAMGIFQMEPATENDIWANYLRYKLDLSERLQALLAVMPARTAQLATNLAYAAAMCRVHYLRQPDPLPKDANDIEALGRYWKRFYNTSMGKGTADEFVRNWTKVLKS
ncbi:MAG: hypothetical protein HQL45_17000 [Alphaproteobacteria bacterium]|nr:hypothetical protein [Alphaproteobacteria bacterium]